MRLAGMLALTGLVTVLVGCSKEEPLTGAETTPTASTAQAPGQNVQKTNTMAPTMNPAAADSSSRIGTSAK